MKTHFIFLSILFASLLSSSLTWAAPAAVSATEPVEDWKGHPEDYPFDFGGMLGAAIIDGNVGFAALGEVAWRVIDKGFISDINDTVFIEAQMGPVFGLAATTLAYSLRMRWDFQKDPTWGLYALGGLGGNYASIAGASHFEMFPQFGIGATYRVTYQIAIRAEISSQFIGAGVSVPF